MNCLTQNLNQLLQRTQRVHESTIKKQITKALQETQKDTNHFF